MATGAIGTHSFGVDRLNRLAEFEGKHFWFEGRRELLRGMLGERLGRPGTVVLDAGCGTGAFLGELARLGQDAVGLDRLPEAVALARRSCPQARVELGDVTALPFPDASFDGILLLDVLEHVDDRRALGETARALRTGGFVAVTVPACPRLWSARDVVAGHRRRYARSELVSRLREAGFSIERVSYYQFFLFPLFALSRLLGRRNRAWLEREERVPRGLGRALGSVSRWEARLGKHVRWPVGSSLVAVAVKP